MTKYYAVSIESLDPSCEIPIVVREDGKATNRFADGVVGVPRYWQELAEDMFEPEYDPILEDVEDTY